MAGQTSLCSGNGRTIMNTESYIQSLLVSNPLRELTLRAMVMALQLPKGSGGLDAGCGIGLQCLLLAEEVGLTRSCHRSLCICGDVGSWPGNCEGGWPVRTGFLSGRGCSQPSL